MGKKLTIKDPKDINGAYADQDDQWFSSPGGNLPISKSPNRGQTPYRGPNPKNLPKSTRNLPNFS